MDVEEIFDLNECVDWIVKNDFDCIALQFPNHLLKYNVFILNYLKEKQNVCSDFYTIISNCCSVDYLSPLHLNGRVKAILRFGNHCFSCLSYSIKELPVLFIFENVYSKTENKFLFNFISQLSDDNCLIITEPTYFLYTLDIVNFLGKKLSFPKWIQYTELWFFTKKIQQYFINEKDLNEVSYAKLYNMILNKELNEFNKVIYIGDVLPLSYNILSLTKLVYVDMKENKVKEISGQKYLMKRIALIEKVKTFNKIGILFTHSYPNVNDKIKHILKLSRKTKKKVYFISSVRTNDQFKLGNFSTLEAIVIVKNCFCSNLINTTNLHFPLIDFIEFEISCGLKRNYGQIVWNSDFENDEFSDTSNNSENEDQNNLNLVLDERKDSIIQSLYGKKKWFGLQVNAGCDEVAKLQDGLKGLALNYEGEGKK